MITCQLAATDPTGDTHNLAVRELIDTWVISTTPWFVCDFENDQTMKLRRLSSIFFSAIALGLMLLVIVATFFSFDAGFVRQIIDSQDISWPILALCAVVAIAVFLASMFALYRGVNLWRADSWLKDDRVITGAELKLEAAVMIGLGITVAYIFFRGLI